MIRKIVELRLPAMATIKNTRQTTAAASRLGVMMLIKVRKLYLRQCWLPISQNRFPRYGPSPDDQALHFCGILLVRPDYRVGHFTDAGRPRFPWAGLVERFCPRR